VANRRLITTELRLLLNGLIQPFQQLEKTEKPDRSRGGPPFPPWFRRQVPPFAVSPRATASAPEKDLRTLFCDPFGAATLQRYQIGLSPLVVHFPLR
jgi:hypothetical protein